MTAEQQEIDTASKQLLEDWKKKDPQVGLKIEMGRLLLRHVNMLSPAEKARLEELKGLLKPC